ncbi:replication fork protection component Swi3-domain-containing protein [Xylaria telfairii]|nr:replication fork protection component Swi3-domain-containing protein [Xylaria telfairii]
MASRLASRPSAPPLNPANALDNYDVDDDPFADSGDDAAQQDGGAGSRSKKRKDASGLGIDEAVSVSKKPRVPRVKLDETRLLSDNGIPKLRRKARDLKFKGKGHEFSDTARLLSFYQDWLDNLFPKAKFLDALSMVEKAGHKSQIRLKRIQWIDEGRPRPAGFDDGGGDDDLFGDSNRPEERDPAIFPARLAPIFQNSLDKPAKTPVDDPFADEDIYGASPKRPANTAPTPASLFGNGADAQTHGEPDEDDLDALMAEEEAHRTAPTSIFGSGKMAQARHTPDEDDDLDALMAEAEAETSITKPTKSISHRPAARPVIDEGDDDDDDLDALMAEAEAQGPAAKKPPSPKSSVLDKKEDAAATHGIDEDEEAAMAEMDGLW